MTLRHPPIIGIIGVDFGAKPAISLAIPPEEDEEEPEPLLKHCGIREFDDHNFWPTYDRDAFEAGDYWRLHHFCLRGISFDIRRKQGIELDDPVTNFHAYQLPHGSLDSFDMSLWTDEVDMNWFRDLLTVDAVQELLDLIFSPAPHKSSYHIELWMEMHRDIYRIFDAEAGRYGKRIKQSTDVTLSIPKIYWMCWR